MDTRLCARHSILAFFFELSVLSLSTIGFPTNIREGGSECQNCATHQAQGLGTQSHLSHSPTQWREMNIIDIYWWGRWRGERNSHFFFFFWGTLTLERGLQQQRIPDLKLFGSMWGEWLPSNSQILCISHTARLWSILLKETPFLLSMGNPSLYLLTFSPTSIIHTWKILHLSTYKSFLTSINTLLSSSYNHCLWHHGKILLFISDI